MAKKIENFRNLNQSNKKSTPTKKVGVISENRKNKEDKKNKQSNVFSSVTTFFLILVIIGVSIGILFSPSFNVSELVVADGVNVKSTEISSVVNVKYGENILKQSYKSMKNEVLSLPYIKDAKIKLVLPNKIKVEYTEREPYMLLKYLESYFVVDKFGYLLEIKKEIADNTLPIIYGMDIKDYELGEALTDTDGIKYKNVVSLIETARQREFSYKIYEINYENIGEVKLWVEGFDIDVIYGEIDKNTITDKLNYLSGILEKLKNKKGELDLSSSNYLEKTIFTERYQ